MYTTFVLNIITKDLGVKKTTKKLRIICLQFLGPGEHQQFEPHKNENDISFKFKPFSINSEN